MTIMRMQVDCYAAQPRSYMRSAETLKGVGQRASLHHHQRVMLRPKQVARCAR